MSIKWHAGQTKWVNFLNYTFAMYKYPVSDGIVDGLSPRSFQHQKPDSKFLKYVTPHAYRKFPRQVERACRAGAKYLYLKQTRRLRAADCSGDRRLQETASTRSTSSRH